MSTDPASRFSAEPPGKGERHHPPSGIQLPRPTWAGASAAPDPIDSPSAVQRLRGLAVGLILGSGFSLFTAGPMMPSGLGVADRAYVWAIVMAGPVLATAWGLADFTPVIHLGWLGLPLILLHPLHPSWGTGVLAAIGFALWFFVGFLAVMEAAWGA
jgi:hypothetical protein